MTLKRLDFSIFSRRDPGTTDRGISGVAAPRRGASRRANRARHLALEVMEDRLVLSTPTLVGLSITTTSVSAAQPLIAFGGFLPPTQGDGTGDQLGGNVVAATFKLAADSGPYTVGLADYIVDPKYPFPPPFTDTGLHNYLNAQVYYSSSSAIIDASHSTVDVYVTVYTNQAHSPSGGDCDQQVDAYYGDTIRQFSGSDYYGFFNQFTTGAPPSLLGGAILDCTAAPNGQGAQSQGFYKNHPDALPDTMTIGNVVYTRDQLEVLLHTNPSGGNSTLVNVHQLITAYANQANGVQAPSNILDAMTASELVFDTLPPLIVFDCHGNPIYNKATATKSSFLETQAGILETFNP